MQVGRAVAATLAFAAFVFVGCASSRPHEGAGIGASEPETAPQTISDQAHGGGHAGFFWLPPLVSAPALQGSFDGAQQPVVTITPLVSGAAPIATFTTTSGPGSETIRADSAAQNYIVNWHTDEFALDPSVNYRIAVTIAGRTVGFLDVDVVASKAEAKNVDSSQYVALVDGKTLPIKWFLNACGSVFCEAVDRCHVAGTCAFATGTCSNPNAPDGTACSSANACGRSDTCQSGTCVADVCVPCSSIGDCPPGQACVGGTCGRCTADADCVGSTQGPRCSGGACVECVTNADCTDAGRPQCTANACVACTGDAGCAGHAKTKCELVNAGTPALVGTCVDCRSNTAPSSADCTTDAAPECDSTTGTCGGCSGAAGEDACQRNHGGRHCEDNNTPLALQGTCVTCRGERSYAATDCGSSFPLCSPFTDTCGDCDTDGTSECVKFGAPFVCDNPASGGTGACVGCVTDDDCQSPDAPHCVSKVCVGCDSTTNGDESCARFPSTPSCDAVTGRCQAAP
jgi:hypothetical protein